IKDHLKKYIPYTGGEDDFEKCECNCEHGIVASTKADFLVTATVSDWGVYAVIAALSYLEKNSNILHDEKMEEAVLRTCCLNGMVDMTGSLLPAIDGFSVEIEKQIIALMKSTVDYAMNYKNDTWFNAVLHKGFYK
ncbi:MAG: glutamate cyclase domain-containing protein, partial [Treponema sp.]